MAMQSKKNLLSQSAGIRVAGTQDMSALSAKIGPKTLADLEEAADADELLKISGLIIAADLGKDFSKEDIASLPIVDSVPIDAAGKPTRAGDQYKPVTGMGGNHLPADWTSVQDGKRTKWVSAINGIINGTSFIRDLEKEVTGLDDAMNKRVGAPQKYVSLGDGEKEAMLKKFRKRINNARAKFRTGIEVIQQRASLVECFKDKVTFSFNEDSKGNLIPSPDPIILQMKNKPAKFGSFSVTSFCNMDFPWALANRAADTDVDTWNAILKSLSRTAPTDQPKIDLNKVTISILPQYESALLAEQAWLGNEANREQVYNKINAAKSIEDQAILIDGIHALWVVYTEMAQRTEKARDKLANLRQAREGTLKGDKLLDALNK